MVQYTYIFTKHGVWVECESVSMTLVVHGSFSKEGVNSFSLMALHTVIQKKSTSSLSTSEIILTGLKYYYSLLRSWKRKLSEHWLRHVCPSILPWAQKRIDRFRSDLACRSPWSRERTLLICSHLGQTLQSRKLSICSLYGSPFHWQQ